MPSSATTAERRYARRRPERGALHRAVREHLETFLAERRRAHPDGAAVPRFVERELRAFLRCGDLAYGFAHFRCESCNASRLVAFSCGGRGVCPSCAGRRMTARAADLVDRVLPHVRHRQWVLSLPFWLRWRLAWDHDLTKAVLRVFARVVFGFYRGRARRAGLAGGRTGSVTVVQRFGGAINLNVHFHTLVPDGVWVQGPQEKLTFHPVRPPAPDDLERLVGLVEARVRRLLVSRGLWHDDEDGGAPAPTDDLPGLADLYQASVTQRAGTGRPLRRVGVTMPLDPGTELGARARREGGFDLHAGVAVRADDRDRLEHLCRYLLRPSLSNERLTELPGGDLLLALRRRWSDGTSHLRLSPLELLERLAALVPRPGTNQILYHGLLAANAAWRPRIVPASAPRRPSAPARPSEACTDRANHSWAELLRRGLRIDSLACPKDCGGRLRFVATIERPAVVRKILRHLGLPDEPARVAPARGPPDEHQLGPAA